MPNDSKETSPHHHHRRRQLMGCLHEGVQAQRSDGNSICICNAFDLKAAYAGLQCEYEATEYCIIGGSYSLETFCTNGGTCQRFHTVHQEEHLSASARMDTGGIPIQHDACRCPPSFEGRHCEYRRGEMPFWERESLASTSSTPNYYTRPPPGAHLPMTPAVIAMITVMVIGTCAALVALIAFFVHNTYSNQRRDSYDGSEVTAMTNTTMSTIHDLEVSVKAGMERGRREGKVDLELQHPNQHQHQHQHRPAYYTSVCHVINEDGREESDDDEEEQSRII